MFEKVPENKSRRANGDYFRNRLSFLGPEKYVEFLREESVHWSHPRNLVIANAVYKNATGKDLPDMSLKAAIEEKDAKIRELEAKLAEDSAGLRTVDAPFNPEGEDEVAAMHTISGLSKAKRKRANA